MTSSSSNVTSARRYPCRRRIRYTAFGDALGDWGIGVDTLRTQSRMHNIPSALYRLRLKTNIPVLPHVHTHTSVYVNTSWALTARWLE